jgi:rubrerythrin
MTNSEAIEILQANYPDACFEQLRDAVDIAIYALSAQPTIEPRKKGEWKEHKDYTGLAYLCSECGYFTTMRTNFCPNCGADMREGRTEWAERINDD